MTWHQHDLYDRAGTAKLIAVFHAYPGVQQILFNDATIPFVNPCINHDNHFHVQLRP